MNCSVTKYIFNSEQFPLTWGQIKKSFFSHDNQISQSNEPAIVSIVKSIRFKRELVSDEFLWFKRGGSSGARFASAINRCKRLRRGGSLIKQLRLNRAEFPTLNPHAR